MANLCVYSLIKEADDSCAYALENCNTQEAIYFTHHFFCLIDQNMIITIAFTPILFFVLFNFLAKTADEFLSPAVAYVATYFKLSQTLAGYLVLFFNSITLIAFANGAPDILTAIVAASDEQGALIAVGSIFGGCLFITTMIFGAVLYCAELIRANRTSFLRDLSFNGIGISFLILYALIGYINYIMSAIYVSLYAAYIIVFLVNESQNKKTAAENENLVKSKHVIEENKQLLSPEQKQNPLEIVSNKLLEEDEDAEIERLVNQLPEEKIEEILSDKENYKHSQFHEEHQIKQETNLGQKIWNWYSLPFEYIRLFTIYAQGQEHYNKTYAAIHCLICPIVMLFLLRILDLEVFGIPLWIIFIIIGVVMFLYQITIGFPLIMHVLLSIAASIIWCKTVVEILVDYILLIQTLTEVSFSYLGMTFLALGNSSCDFFVDTKLAKMGFGLMALTGCFAGSVFNMIAGFGAGLIRLTWVNTFRGSIRFNLFRDTAGVEGKQVIIDRMNNSIAHCLLIFSLMNVIMTYVIVKSKKFKLTKNLSYYYFFFYMIFFILITTLTIALDQSIKYLFPK